MESFNENLKKIRILEMIGVGLLSIFIIAFFEIDMQWMFLIPIIYVLFRCRKNLNGLKSCAANLFSDISVKTWLLLIITSYIFAMGSGFYIDEALSNIGFYNILTDNVIFFGSDLLFSVILGPIVEEILFRGILFNRIHRKFSLITAILLSSLLFATFHSYPAIISSFLFGITMCITYVLTDNILMPISLHMTNNLISMLVSYIPNIESIFTCFEVIIIYILTIISLVYILRFNINGYRTIYEKN